MLETFSIYLQNPMARTPTRCRKSNLKRLATRIGEMSPIQRMAPFLVVLLTLASMPISARSDFLLNYQYSGEINSLDDPYGLFSQLKIGNSVSGIIRLCDYHSFFDDGFGYAEYRHNVASGNSLSATISTASGLFDLQAPTEFLTQVYNDPDFHGYGFQSIEADLSLLDYSNLPAGFTVSQLGFLTSFLFSDANLSSYPDLPTSFMSLDSYDIEVAGYIFADVRNSTGQYVGSSFGSFSITSVQAIPEPHRGGLLLGLSLIAIARRNRRQ